MTNTEQGIIEQLTDSAVKGLSFMIAGSKETRFKLNNQEKLLKTGWLT